MSENPSPCQILKGLLQGTPPPRPLFLPIVFSLGARVENTPLRAFLSNPTKISNSLRQIRSHLRSDGVSCYFDPFLECEALGASLEWSADDKPPAIRWPEPAEKGTLPRGLRTPDEAAKSGRVPIAVEVIRRLKSLFRDEPLLMAGVTGPFTLAARLTSLDHEVSLRMEDLPHDALELASTAMTQIASALAAAGANAIFIQEKILPALSAESGDAWASLLTPAINVIRFYEVLSVLHLANTRNLIDNDSWIFERSWDCVLCPTLEAIQLLQSKGELRPGTATLGIALPANALRPGDSTGDDLPQILLRLVQELKPAILTTAGDVPPSTDLKPLMSLFQAVARGG